MKTKSFINSRNNGLFMMKKKQKQRRKNGFLKIIMEGIIKH